MPIAVMWQLTQSWYGDRLDPDFARRSVDEYQAMLDAVGLTGAFWRFG